MRWRRSVRHLQTAKREVSELKMPLLHQAKVQRTTTHGNGDTRCCAQH